MIKRGLGKNKRASRALIFNRYKTFVKSKRSQEVFGMPFSTIFSIFLIVVFVAVAIYAIKYFIGIGKCAENGLFIDELQDAINEAWQSQSSSKTFSSSLSGIEYVCFANLTKEVSATASAKEKEIYKELKKNADYTANLFFNPRKKACVPFTNIKHINMQEISNPYCFKVEDGKVEIKIEKGVYDSLVKVAR